MFYTPGTRTLLFLPVQTANACIAHRKDEMEGERAAWASERKTMVEDIDGLRVALSTEGSAQLGGKAGVICVGDGGGVGGGSGGGGGVGNSGGDSSEAEARNEMIKARERLEYREEVVRGQQREMEKEKAVLRRVTETMNERLQLQIQLLALDQGGKGLVSIADARKAWEDLQAQVQ